MNSRVVFKSIRMENFGCFTDTTITFTDGLNQLVGPNESGKSTILRALFVAIFEDGSTQKKNIHALVNWHVHGPFKLTLNFTVDDKQFTLNRDYGTGSDIMIDSDGVTYEGKALREEMARYFGTADRSLYESVFCFASDNPASLDGQRDKLKSALETPVFFGFDRSRADKYLDNRIKQIENPKAHGPRELDVIDDQMHQFLHEKIELEKKLSNLDKTRKELDDVARQSATYEEEMKSLETQLNGASAYVRLDDKMAGLEERLQTHLAAYSRAEQAMEDVEKLERELDKIYIPDTRHVDQFAARRDELAESVETAKFNMDVLLANRGKANRGFLIISLSLVVLCLVFVLSDLGYIDTGMAERMLPFAVAFVALVWVLKSISYTIMVSRKKKATKTFRSEMAKLDAYYAELNDTYQLGAADPIKAMYELVNRRQAIEMSIENVRGTINLLSDGKGLDHLVAVKGELEKEVAEINRELGPLVQYASLATEIPGLSEKLTARRVRINALREQTALLTERCSGIEPLKQSIAKIEGELEALKRKHIDINEELEVLKITRAAINRAADSLIEETFAQYSQTASTHLSALTHGHHSALRFVKETKSFEINLDGKDLWREINENLSSSTRDALYISLHMAAMDYLTDGFAVPVVFDQADARMDSQRRSKYHALIKAVAAERQVIHVDIVRSEDLNTAHVIECKEVEEMVPLEMAES